MSYWTSCRRSPPKPCRSFANDLRLIAICCCCASLAPSQEPQPDQLLEAVANSAAIFVHTAPGLTARETLHQRGRRGFVQLMQDATATSASEVKIHIPPDFHTHEVVSGYAFGAAPDSFAIHELRSILTIDGKTVSSESKVRHALTLGLRSGDDKAKRRLLEDFESNRLEGAVIDFGQSILLFSAARQNNYDFTLQGTAMLNDEKVDILHYRQVSGSDGVTVFRNRTQERNTTEGQLWIRDRDLLPVRITMNTSEPLSRTHIVRDEAVIDYHATASGLAPLHVVERQFLDDDLMVENDLQYTDVGRLTPGLIP